MYIIFNRSALILLAVILLPTLSLAHPSDGYEANSLPHNYGTLDFKVARVDHIGDLTFTCPYPDPGLLTEAEKYMIAGTDNGPGGHSLAPWVRIMGQMLSVYYAHEQYIPQQFSDEILLKVMGGELPDQQWRIDEFKSPITNEFPRLDAWEFSRGDMYVHVLTEAEKLEYASVNPELYDLWFNNRAKDPDCPDDDPSTVEATPVPALFIRVYGENDVIWELITIGAALR